MMVSLYFVSEFIIGVATGIIFQKSKDDDTPCKNCGCKPRWYNKDE